VSLRLDAMDEKLEGINDNVNERLEVLHDQVSMVMSSVKSIEEALRASPRAPVPAAADRDLFARGARYGTSKRREGLESLAAVTQWGSSSQDHIQPERQRLAQGSAQSVSPTSSRGSAAVGQASEGMGPGSDRCQDQQHHNHHGHLTVDIGDLAPCSEGGSGDTSNNPRGGGADGNSAAAPAGEGAESLIKHLPKQGAHVRFYNRSPQSQSSQELIESARQLLANKKHTAGHRSQSMSPQRGGSPRSWQAADRTGRQGQPILPFGVVPGKHLMSLPSTPLSSSPVASPQFAKLRWAAAADVIIVEPGSPEQRPARDSD